MKLHLAAMKVIQENKVLDVILKNLEKKQKEFLKKKMKT